MSGSVWEQRKWRIYKIYYCNNYRKTVKHNVSVRFFTSCGESESSKIVLKSTRKKKNNKNNNNNKTSYNVHYTS